MLTTIREKTQGWIAGIILALVAVPFALWGINAYFEGGGNVNVAQVNGTDISVDSYRRNLDEQRRSLQRMLGRGVDPRLFDTPAFRQQVLDSMIDDMLFVSEVESQGYRASTADLARQIRSVPQFQRDGQFDPKLYEALVRNEGRDVRSYEAGLQQNFAIRQAQSGFDRSALLLPSDLENLLKLQGQQREASVALLRPARLRGRVQVSAQDIEQEYQANAVRYTTPERVRVEYLRLAASDLAAGIRVSDEDVRKAMAETAASAVGKEERRARHILIKLPTGADAKTEQAAMTKIQGLRAKLASGADFATLARQNSEDPGSAAQGGDLGFVGRGVMVKEFEQALFALKKSELSAPVRTSFGLHLIQLTDIKKPPAAPVVARAKIEAELKARKAEERFFELSEKFNNLVYEQPDSLKPAAETLGLSVQTSEWFTRSGGSGILANPKLVEAAFDPEVLTQGRNSNVIEIAPNTLVALRIHAHEPPRQQPLAEVRAQIETALLAKAAQTEAGRLAEEALGKLRAGQAFDAVTKQYGMEVQGQRIYGRKTPGIDPSVLAALFKAAHPQSSEPVFGETVLADGTVAVFALKRVIQPAKPDSKDAEAENLRKALEARRGREFLESYRAGLRQGAKIKVYKDQL